MKITQLIVTLLIFNYSSFLWSNELDMTGIWVGENITDQEERRIYTVRTKDGYYFSRHEYYQNDVMVRWLHNYGIWGQNENEFWTDFVVYASSTSRKTLPLCNPPRAIYFISSIERNITTYVAERDGIEYKMEKVSKLPTQYFSKESELQKYALKNINAFKRECIKEI